MNFNPTFILLALLVSFPQLSETIYTPSLPELAKYFGTTANMMQQTLSIYFIGFAVGVFFFGRLCDVMGRKKSLLLGIFVYILASFACIHASNIGFFLMARFLQAFGASVGSVVTQTMLRDLYTGEQRARVFSHLTAVIAFAPGLGPLIGSRLSHVFSPVYNFWFLFGLGIALFFWSSLGIKETWTGKNDKAISLHKLFARMIKDPHIWLAAFTIAAHNGILFSLHAEAPFILMEKLAMNPAHYGILGLLLSSSVFIGSMINSRLLRKHSPYILNMLGCIVMVLSSLVLVLCLPYQNLFSKDVMLAIFLLLTALIIVGMGISLPNCLSLALKDYRDAVGSAGAILGLIYYVMIGGFLALMSAIHDGSLWPMPLYFFSLAIALAFGAWGMLRKMRSITILKETTA